jgi:hypothetical protein
VLTFWLAALAVVLVGGSLFVFLVKGGTVGVRVRGEEHAGPIERTPLLPESIGRASAFGLETFAESAKTLFPRFARLGAALMAVYGISGLVYLVVLARLSESGWAVLSLISIVFVAWVTVVNLGYLLTQIVIAADGCTVGAAASRVASFLRRDVRRVSGVFLIVLGLVALATIASVLATAALWLVGFVPFFGLAVLPLQVLAWILRTLVFQFIGLASVGAYVKLYRAEPAGSAVRRLSTAEV